MHDSNVEINLLDGIQNILPYGVGSDLQNASSNLVDAYKRNELDKSSFLSFGLAIFGALLFMLPCLYVIANVYNITMQVPITARAGRIPSIDNATNDINKAMMAINSILSASEYFLKIYI